MSVLTKTLVEVDVEACRRLADLLRRQHVPDDQEEINFDGFERGELGNLLLLLVAICHQTSPRGRAPLQGRVGGKQLRGWDYLLQKFEAEATTSRELLEPDCWAVLAPSELARVFRTEAGEDLLSDVEGRSRLINDLGEKMLEADWRRIDEAFSFCGGRIASADPCLRGTLSRFRAYDDPVCKKTYFYLGLMRNTGLWSYEDPENLGAPVDYHEVRGHLRVGTVRVVDESLRAKLKAAREVSAEEDVALRGAVLEAIMHVSTETGFNNPSKLHYLFWNVFRNYCKREEANCFGVVEDTYLPERYRELSVKIDGRRACPFVGVCSSKGVESRILEHVFETDYY